MPKHYIPNLIGDLLSNFTSELQTISNTRVNLPNMKTDDMRVHFKAMAATLVDDLEKTLFDYSLEEAKKHPKWTDPRDGKTCSQTDSEFIRMLLKATSKNSDVDD